MKKISFVLGALLLTGIMACKNADRKNNNPQSSQPLKTKADSLYDQVIKEHNEGMSGWMKIKGIRKQINTLLDSIARLPSKAQPSLNILKAKLNEATEELDDAYKLMDDWMTDMNLDSAVNNVELRIQYLTGEKMKGSKITELINNSLQKADSLLKTKF
jgi:DNA repair ATPase RecN